MTMKILLPRYSRAVACVKSLVVRAYTRQHVQNGQNPSMEKEVKNEVCSLT